VKDVVRFLYGALVWLLFADLVLQFYFAAYGVFSAGRANFSYHSQNANVLFVLMLVTLIVALIASFMRVIPWARTLQQLLLPILLIGQIGLFILDEAIGGTEQHPVSWLLGLHAVNGLLMLLLTLRLALLGLRRQASIEASV
jgi:membrane-associated HD superfamily phosphohydrolase